MVTANVTGVIPGLTANQEIRLLIVGVVLIVVLTADRFLLRSAFEGAMRRFQRLPVAGNLVSDELRVAAWIDRSIGLVLIGTAVLVSLVIAQVDIGPLTQWLLGAGISVRDWLLTSGVSVAVIVVFAYASAKLLRAFAQPVIRTSITRGKVGIALDEANKRSDALAQVTGHAIRITTFIITAFMILAQLNINIAPLLAGVSVIGIAVGFGAQNTVRDLIAGAFIIGENQYRVGDVASVGGQTGLVEGLNLRRTTLRDLDGVVHYIPNGEITVASNYTKEFSRVNLDVGVAYKEDLDRVIRVLNRIGAEMANDSYYGPLIIEAPRAIRVNNFGDSSIDVKVLGVTQPIRQWEVMGELRRRIKRTFDEMGIEIPFPHRTIYWGVGAHPATPPHTATRPRESPDVPPVGVQADSLGADPFVAAHQEHAARAEEVLSRDLMLHTDAVLPLIKDRKFGLLLDIDGTLARLNPNPAAVAITAAKRQALDRIARRINVGILTGRSVGDARNIVGLANVTYAGNHGMQWWQAGRESVLPEAARYVSLVHDIAEQAKRRLVRVQGVIVEDKGPTLSIHFRASTDRESASAAIEDFLTTNRDVRTLIRRDARMVIELLPPVHADKGTALTSFAQDRGLDSVLVLGDDYSDLDSFRAAKVFGADEEHLAMAVAVLTAGTPMELVDEANFTLDDADAVEAFLQWLSREL